MREKCRRYFEKIDDLPLWMLGILVAIVNFYPYFKYGQKSVFPVHDQLDETFLSYVITARHLFESGKQLPEMLGGYLYKDGLQPSAPLFCYFIAF